jgi:hypothetical protein
MPTNNVLVLLTWSSTEPIVNQVLVEWANSDASLSVYERIIKIIQERQTIEQLVLALAALLRYQRLLPVTHNDQSVKGSYQADFDAILSGERLGNEPTVLEHMGFSVLRVYYTVKDNEKMRLFLATVLHNLHIKPPVLDPSHELSDQYWIYRVRDEFGHKKAFALAGFGYMREKTVGLAISGEEEMEILGNEKEQGEEVVAAVDPQWEEDSVASPGVSDVDDRLWAFPNNVFHRDVRDVGPASSH